MKCKNCQSEMTALNGAPYAIPSLLWCDQCGMLVVDRPKLYNDLNITDTPRETIWFEPKSIEDTKKLVKELIKARNKSSASLNYIGQQMKDDADKIDWGEDERR